MSEYSGPMAVEYRRGDECLVRHKGRWRRARVVVGSYGDDARRGCTVDVIGTDLRLCGVSRRNLRKLAIVGGE